MSVSDGYFSSISSGYIGSPERWFLFFGAIATEYNVPCWSEGVDLDFLLAEISDKEKVLGFNFPKSYRDFVLSGGVSFMNGIMKSMGLTSGVGDVFLKLSWLIGLRLFCRIYICHI